MVAESEGQPWPDSDRSVCMTVHVIYFERSRPDALIVCGVATGSSVPLAAGDATHLAIGFKGDSAN